MSLTLADIILHVRDLLNEPAAAFFTDAALTRFIQAATLDITTLAHCIQSTSTLTMVLNQPNYSLGGTVVDVHHALWSATRDGLRKITPTLQGDASPDMTGTGNKPLRFYVWGSTLYVEPKPNATAVGGTVIAYTSLSSTDVTQLPDACQVLAIWYATAMGKMQDRQFAEAQQYLSLYYQGLALRRSEFYARLPQGDAEASFTAIPRLAGVQYRG
jgi:hypothetical protein